MTRHSFITVTACLLLLVTGCGDNDGFGGERPKIGKKGDESSAGRALGFPLFATKNTTRVGGSDATANAAAVALAVFPGNSTASRPTAVTLADGSDWRVALLATQLEAAPLHAPVLLTDGDDMPDASKSAIEELEPRGLRKLNGAQAIRVGNAAEPSGLKSTQIHGSGPYELSRAIDRFRTTKTGRRSNELVIVSADSPAYAMPAAGWAARSGDPIYFAHRRTLPAATVRAVRMRKRPQVYVLGPRAVIGTRVLTRLRKLGAQVRRISGDGPVGNAIAFARYADGDFGFGVTDPGHGLVFTRTDEPQNAVAAALLSNSGTYGPLLLTDSGEELPAVLRDYLLDIQPGYESDPVRGVYNHGWLIGDSDVISAALQTKIDSLLEIVPVGAQ